MIQTLVKPLSIDEFLKLPETKPACELIDGVAIAKPDGESVSYFVIVDFYFFHGCSPSLIALVE